jgi:hypothetical protein
MEINITNKTAFPIDEDTHNFILNESMKCHDIELQKLKQEQIEWLESIRDTMLEKSAHTGKDDDYWIFEKIEFKLRHLKGE